jgi:hypothetical protein
MSQSGSQQAPSSLVPEDSEGTGSQQSSTPTSSSAPPADLQRVASSSRRVVLIDQEPTLLAASQAHTAKPKRKSKSLLKRNQSRLETHKYLQAHPEVVPEFATALKHKEKSNLESSSSQATSAATLQQPSSPERDRPASFLATAPQINRPETEVQFTVTLDGFEQCVSEAEPELEIDCGSEFEMSS